MNYSFKTKDHPEANGREPQDGDVEYEVELPLEDEGKIILRLGEESYKIISEFIKQMEIDSK